MSEYQKTLFAVIISFLFILCASDAGAASPVGAVGGKGAPPTSQNQVSKTAQIVRAITDNTLYLENNQSYDLSGVNVIDLTGKSRVSQNKIIADMMFVNGVLKEVVLR